MKVYKGNILKVDPQDAVANYLVEDNGQQGIMTSSSRMRSMQIERPTAKSL